MSKHWPRQLGVHLTEHSLRVVEIVGGGTVVHSWGRIALPRPLPLMKKDRSIPELADAFKAALQSTKPRPARPGEAVLTIGDEDVFSKVVTMPKMDLAQAREAAPHELESDLPLKAESMYVDVSVLKILPDQPQMEAMVFAMNRGLVDWFLEAADAIRLPLVAIETASLSLGRLYQAKQQSYITVDIGSNFASIAIFANDLIHVSNSVSLQDPAWEKALAAQELAFGPNDLATQFNIFLTNLTEKIIASLRFYQNRVPNAAPIEKVFLSGSGARMPHLDTVLAQYLQLPVVIGQPVGVTCKGKQVCDTSYLAAIGAGIREKDE
ncbi:MAG: hypothetical protein Q7S64_01210 [bacterium]|nr:hypothetical protein [bacterium]